MKEKLPRQVERGLQDLATEEPEPFHYERTMTRVKAAASNSRRERTMKTLISTAVGFGVVAAIFLALVFIPATYTVTLGSIVTVQLPTLEIPQDEILSATAGIEGVTSSTISMTNDQLQLNFAFNGVEKKEAEKRIRTAMTDLVSDVNSLTMTSDNVTVEAGGNALAALTGGHITINARGMNDEEIEAAIVAELQAHLGAGGSYYVDVNSNESGEMTIQIEATAGPGEDLPEEFQINVEAGDVPSNGQRRVERRIIHETEDE